MPTYRTWEIGCKMGGTVLSTTVKEKDLGVKISVEMKSSVVLQLQRVITFLG